MPNAYAPNLEAARTRLERVLVDATPHPCYANVPQDEFDVDHPSPYEVTVHLSVAAAHDLAAALEDYYLHRLNHRAHL